MFTQGSEGDRRSSDRSSVSPSFLRLNLIAGKGPFSLKDFLCLEADKIPS